MAALHRIRLPLQNLTVGLLRQKLRLSTSSCLSKEKDLVVVEQLGKVMTIGINRPEVRNCVNPATARELIKAFKTFEETEEASVAVLHGKGGCFSAGFDLKALSGRQLDPQSYGDPEHSDNAGMGPSRKMFSKPVIAAIDGYAVAGGLELALMCDLRVVEENAIMGVFCRRWGVPLIDGGTVRLPALIGLSRALDLVLTGRPVSAKEALEMGLANRVVATGTALGQAVQLAQGIAHFPQRCMLTDRASCYHSTFNARSWKDAFQYEWTKGQKVIQDEAVPAWREESSALMNQVHPLLLKVNTFLIVMIAKAVLKGKQPCALPAKRHKANETAEAHQLKAAGLFADTCTGRRLAETSSGETTSPGVLHPSQVPVSTLGISEVGGSNLAEATSSGVSHALEVPSSTLGISKCTVHVAKNKNGKLVFDKKSECNVYMIYDN